MHAAATWDSEKEPIVEEECQNLKCHWEIVYHFLNACGILKVSPVAQRVLEDTLISSLWSEKWNSQPPGKCGNSLRLPFSHTPFPIPRKPQEAVEVPVVRTWRSQSWGGGMFSPHCWSCGLQCGQRSWPFPLSFLLPFGSKYGYSCRVWGRVD